MANINSHKWQALSPNEWFTSPDSNETLLQNGDQFSISDEDSANLILVKDSCNITIHTTDTKASVSLQLGLQLAIVLLVSITVGDTDRSMAIAREIIQGFEACQKSQRKIIVVNCRDVTITITETDISANIQALLQVLLALVIRADIL